MNSSEVGFIALAIASFVGTPVSIVWGWIRVDHARNCSGRALASVGALALATSSVLLGVGTAVYSQAIGGFPFYDPRLLRIYRIAAVLSLLTLLLALIGVTKKNPVRWLSIIAALTTAGAWMVLASGE